MQVQTKEGSEKKQPQRLTINLEQQGVNQSAMPAIISQTSHPIIAGLHIIGKIGVVFVYLTFPFITSPFNVLVAVIIASAIDFWIVKNLSGRLLVGLRWWIDFSEDGEQQWKFECKVNQKDVTLVNERAFWWTLVIFGIIWVALAVINVLSFKIPQVTICIFCFTLIFFNLFSFYRCSKVQKENVSRLYNVYGGETAARFMSGSIISSFR